LTLQKEVQSQNELDRLSLVLFNVVAPNFVEVAEVSHLVLLNKNL